MTEVFHCDGSGMHDVSCRVVGSVDVEDVDGGCKCLQWESQPFSDQGVDEGGIGSTIQKCGDFLKILSLLQSNTYVNEELTVLVDSAGIDVFRDLIGNRNGNRFFFMGFVDGMKHRVRASAMLWTS